eukprot:Clim_evm5s49 gene=Clim_evmTU5s49
MTCPDSVFYATLNFFARRGLWDGLRRALSPSHPFYDNLAAEQLLLGKLYHAVAVLAADPAHVNTLDDVAEQLEPLSNVERFHNTVTVLTLFLHELSIVASGGTPEKTGAVERLIGDLTHDDADVNIDGLLDTANILWYLGHAKLCLKVLEKCHQPSMSIAQHIRATIVKGWIELQRSSARVAFQTFDGLLKSSNKALGAGHEIAVFEIRVGRAFAIMAAKGDGKKVLAVLDRFGKDVSMPWWVNIDLADVHMSQWNTTQAQDAIRRCSDRLTGMHSNHQHSRDFTTDMVLRVLSGMHCVLNFGQSASTVQRLMELERHLEIHASVSKQPWRWSTNCLYAMVLRLNQNWSKLQKQPEETGTPSKGAALDTDERNMVDTLREAADAFVDRKAGEGYYAVVKPIGYFNGQAKKESEILPLLYAARSSLWSMELETAERYFKQVLAIHSSSVPGLTGLVICQWLQGQDPSSGLSLLAELRSKLMAATDKDSDSDLTAQQLDKAKKVRGAVGELFVTASLAEAALLETVELMNRRVKSDETITGNLKLIIALLKRAADSDGSTNGRAVRLFCNGLGAIGIAGAARLEGIRPDIVPWICAVSLRLAEGVDHSQVMTPDDITHLNTLTVSMCGNLTGQLGFVNIALAPRTVDLEIAIGNYAKAKEQLRSAIILLSDKGFQHDETIDMCLKYVDLCLDSGDTSESGKVLERLERIKPSTRSTAVISVYLARQRIATCVLGQSEAAQDISGPLKTLLADPEVARYLTQSQQVISFITLAQAYMHRTDYVSAKEALSFAEAALRGEITSRPGSSCLMPRYKILLQEASVDLDMRSGNVEQAITQLEASLSQASAADQRMLRDRLAKVYLDFKGDVQAFLTVYLSGVKLASKSGKPNFSVDIDLARAYSSVGRHDRSIEILKGSWEAFEDLSKSATIEDSDKQVGRMILRMIGSYCHIRGDISEALSHYEQAAGYDPRKCAFLDECFPSHADIMELISQDGMTPGVSGGTGDFAVLPWSMRCDLIATYIAEGFNDDADQLVTACLEFLGECPSNANLDSSSQLASDIVTVKIFRLAACMHIGNYSPMLAIESLEKAYEVVTKLAVQAIELHSDLSTTLPSYLQFVAMLVAQELSLQYEKNRRLDKAAEHLLESLQHEEIMGSSRAQFRSSSSGIMLKQREKELVRYAELMVRSGDDKGVESLISKMHKVNPDNPALALVVIDLAIRKGNLKQAKEQLQRTLQKFPTNMDALWRYIDVCYLTGDLPHAARAASAAETALAKAQKITGTTTLTRLGPTVAQASDSGDDSILVDIEDELTGLKYCKALLAYVSGRQIQAMSLLDGLDDHALYGQRTCILKIQCHLLGTWGGNPGMARVYRNDQGRLSEARAVYQTLRRLEQGGNVNGSDTLEYYEQLIRVASLDKGMLQGIVSDLTTRLTQPADLGRKSGKPAGGPSTNQQQHLILGIYQPDLSSLRLLSCALLALKNVSKAKGILKAAVQVRPSSKQTREDLEACRLYLSTIYLATNQYDKAVEHALGALELNSSCGRAHEILGEIFDKDGNRERGAQHFEKAWNLMGNSNMDTGAHLTTDLIKTGRYLKAIEIGNQVLEVARQESRGVGLAERDLKLDRDVVDKAMANWRI